MRYILYIILNNVKNQPQLLIIKYIEYDYIFFISPNSNRSSYFCSTSIIKSSILPVSTLPYFTFNGYDGNVISSTSNTT